MAAGGSDSLNEPPSFFLFIRTLATSDESILSRGVELSYAIINSDPPATCDPEIIQAAEASAKQIGASYYKMVGPGISHASSLSSRASSSWHCLNALPIQCQVVWFSSNLFPPTRNA